MHDDVEVTKCISSGSVLLVASLDLATYCILKRRVFAILKCCEPNLTKPLYYMSVGGETRAPKSWASAVSFGVSGWSDAISAGRIDKL
ncbi:hypothetical protein KC345_g17 [Hortaea werneckii]|nr:hypothetical protein KC345_g17 [Hortaea werneckii]